MSMAKHTPGPWVFVPDEDIPGFREPDRVLIGKREYDVGGTANAHLVAAAPDLLEALKYVRRFVMADEKFDKAMVNNAIAKAEGGAQ